MSHISACGKEDGRERERASSAKPQRTAGRPCGCNGKSREKNTWRQDHDALEASIRNPAFTVSEMGNQLMV